MESIEIKLDPILQHNAWSFNNNAYFTRNFPQSPSNFIFSYLSTISALNLPL